ncbi:MAG TPA: hypothetical protein VGB85_15360 [Nannocystis sp.]|jgi:hypothetical protein
MHHSRRALALLALLVLIPMGGCVKLDSFSCAQSSECQNGDVLGTCELGGVCSFPDAACPSGKKYGELAGEQSGQCVDMPGDTTGAPTTSPTEPATTDASSTTFDPDSSTTFDPTTMTSEVSATTTGATTTTSSTTTTGEPDTTTGGPTCGEVGSACVEGVCCGGCAVCDGDNICRPAPADQKPCGVCSVCGDNGECSFEPADSPCPTDCGAIVWQEMAGMASAACYAYDPMPTDGACDGAGSCMLPDPVVAKCPEPDPKEATPLAKCELLCKEEKNPCIPGGPASAVDMDSYCFVQTPSPGCTTTCSDDKTFLNPASCVDGVCVHTMQDECGSYVCDPEALMCLEACVDSDDCAVGLVCTDGVCA